jgi:hypothetical protein
VRQNLTLIRSIVTQMIIVPITQEEWSNQCSQSMLQHSLCKRSSGHARLDNSSPCPSNTFDNNMRNRGEKDMSCSALTHSSSPSLTAIYLECTVLRASRISWGDPAHA